MDPTQLPGKPPNSDQDKGPELLRILWVLGSLSTTIVGLRIYAKLQKTRRLYWDDGLMVLALAFGLTYAATTTVAIHYGFGHHILYLNQQDLGQTLKWGILTMAWGILSPMTGRISFCVTLLFLAGTDVNVKRWPIWSFIVIQILVNLAAVVALYAQCGTSLDILWTPSKASLMPTHCFDPTIQTKLGYFVGSVNCVTDTFLTVLPAVLIKHTKLSLKKKVGLACLLCLSVLALAASIVKTYAVKALSEVLDYTYDLAYYVIWMSVELNVVIIVTSIPLIRPLFQRRKPQLIEPETAKWDDTITLNSAFSIKGARSRVVPMSVSSQENIVPHLPDQYEMNEPQGITVTREVSVTYQAHDTPFVHASLVGLVQGEIANPHLVRR